MTRISTSKTPLNEIFSLDIQSLESALKTRERKGTVKRYQEIEQDIIAKGLARDLPTYLLYRYQFDDLSLHGIAEELGVSPFTLSRLMKEMKIPTKTIRELRTGTHISEETRAKISKSNLGVYREPYNQKELEIINSFIGGDVYRHFNKGEYIEMQSALSKEGFHRTINALRVYVNDLKYPDSKRVKRIRKKDSIKRKTRQHLTEIINSELDNLPEDTETDTLIGSSKSKKSRIRRKKWIKEVPIGHQKLLIYMTDPENYKRLFEEEGIKLVKADFRRKDCKSEENIKLYQRFHKQIKSLEQHTLEDDEMINFADGWMRCDLIYRRTNGEYVVLEVKQNAVNKNVIKKEKGKKIAKHYRNADRTYEQIVGYIAGLGARIERHNTKHKKEPGFVRIPRHVDGYVAAYEIQDDLKEDMGNRIGYFEISREKVNQYIEERLDEHVEERRKKTGIKKASKQAEYPVPAVVTANASNLHSNIFFHYAWDLHNKHAECPGNNPLLLGYEERLSKPYKGEIFTELKFMSIDIEGLSSLPRVIDKETFRTLYELISKVPRGPIGIYNRSRKTIEILGVSYQLNGSHSRTKKIEKLAREGKLELRR